MGDKTIKITKSVCNHKQPYQSYLELDDGGSTVVEHDDVITWEVKSDKIQSILIEDDKSVNLFVPDPAPLHGSNFKKWQGTVRTNIVAGQEESYKIYWSEKGVVYCYDPKIQVKS